MKILYYSEILEKTFNSEEELRKAEAEYKERLDAQQKLRNEQEVRYNEVKEAYEIADKAYEKANELNKKYIEDYPRPLIGVFKDLDDFIKMMEDFFK